MFKKIMIIFTIIFLSLPSLAAEQSYSRLYGRGPVYNSIDKKKFFHDRGRLIKFKTYY